MRSAEGRRAGVASRRSKRAIDRWSPLLLLLWVALNFAWTIPFGFINDDYIWIYGASTAPSPAQALVVQPLAYGGWFLRPLVQGSFVLNYAVGGTHPESYRALNIAAHAGVVLLLWWMLRPLVGGGWVPLIAAAAFAVRPNSAETVVWVSGRTEVLCALFYLGAVAAHLHGRLALGVSCFVLALAAKESAVSLPLLLAGLVSLSSAEVTTPGRVRELARLWPYVAALVLYLAARALLLGSVVPLPLDLTAPQALAIARHKITLLGQYLFSPLPLYGFRRSLLLLALGPLAALWCTRSSPAPNRLGVRAGVLWACVTLLPYAAWPFTSPWYTYLPSMGVSLAVAALGADLLRRLPGRAVALGGAGAAALWLGTSVVLLQEGNARMQRAGRRTEAVTTALARVVGPPPLLTVFVLSGFENDLAGMGGETPVLLFGLTEALRMRAGSNLIFVEHGDRRHAEARAAAWPVVLLEWDERSQELRRTWQSFP
jgi:hypothetical protein